MGEKMIEGITSLPADLIIIILFAYRIPIADKIFSIQSIREYTNREDPKFISFILATFRDIKFGIGEYWRTIIIPILITLVFFIMWAIAYKVIFFHHIPFPASYESIPSFIISIIGLNLILAPAAEEIIECTFISWIYTRSQAVLKNKFKNWGINIFALLLISFIITAGHCIVMKNSSPSITPYIQIFLMFLFYGVIYHLNDRNLLPAIMTHFTWNLLVTFLI